MNTIECNICYENKLCGIPCNTCQKEMCVDCEHTLINTKCPFCRTSTLNWYQKFKTGNCEYKNVVINKYVQSQNEEIIKYNNNIQFIKFVIKFRNLQMLKVFKKQSSKIVKALLMYIRELLYGYIIKHENIKTVEFCFEMIYYIKLQNYKNKLWNPFVYQDLVWLYLNDYVLTNKSIYNNTCKDKVLYKQFYYIQRVFSEIVDFSLALAFSSDENKYITHHTKDVKIKNKRLKSHIKQPTPCSYKHKNHTKH